MSSALRPTPIIISSDDRDLRRRAQCSWSAFLQCRASLASSRGTLSDVTPTVRYDPRADGWHFGDQRRRSDGAYSLVIKHADLASATATDLARALRKARQSEAEPGYRARSG